MVVTLTFEEYVAWHRETLGEDLISTDLSARNEAATGVLQSTAESHSFISSLASHLATLASEGVLQEATRPPDLVLVRKSFQSLSNKLFRKNCIWNRRWPNPPDKGWITYTNSFSRINDLIRTSIICRYLDGPQRVSEEISRIAEGLELAVSTQRVATDGGYYAWHCYVLMPATVIVSDTATNVDMNIEFQITTQLQSVLRELTHKIYEQDRGRPAARRSENRWEYQSTRFRSEYLGHTLHLVDAMIVELRETQKAANGDAPIPKIATQSLESK
jgi:ppGpp synthetase/RelA/SpoT-type nucleotidyltranferase